MLIGPEVDPAPSDRQHTHHTTLHTHETSRMKLIQGRVGAGEYESTSDKIWFVVHYMEMDYSKNHQPHIIN